VTEQYEDNFGAVFSARAVSITRITMFCQPVTHNVKM